MIRVARRVIFEIRPIPRRQFGQKSSMPPVFPNTDSSTAKSESFNELLLRDFLFKNVVRLSPDVRADNKVVLVTGGNTGIGKTTSMELAKRGAKVYMACRDMKKCNETRQEIITESKNQNVYCGECDLADFNSIRKFAEEFKGKEKKLDILINNAGVMGVPKSYTKQGIELHIGTNHFGHFLLTGLLIENLIRATPSRIVVISSLAHGRGTLNFDDLNSEKLYDPNLAYSQSKIANILFASELAKKLDGTGVTVNSLHPGIINTEITRHMGFQNNPVAQFLMRPLLRIFMKTPEQGALTTLFVALEPSLSKTTGKYFSDSKEKAVFPEAGSVESAKRLWKISEEWTKFKYNI